MAQVSVQLLNDYPALLNVWLPTFIVSLLVTGGLYFLARRTGLMMPPVRDRDVHAAPKPRIGGVAIWVSTVLALLLVAHQHRFLPLLDFHRHQYFGVDISLLGILAGMAVLLLFGIIDDLKDLSWKALLLSQFLAALCLVLAGVGVEYVRLPFDHIIYLNGWIVGVPGGGHLEVWSAVFTMIWTMTTINVINFFDGLDGLAASVTFTASLVLLMVSLAFGFTATATLSLVLSAVAAGYLPWNWYPSKLIMGTVGSQTLGFLLAVIAIISGGKLATALLVLGIPFFDAIIVIIRRLLAGQSPFKADQRHLHHRLLKIGLPTPWVVVLINFLAVTFGVLALRVQQSTGKGLLTLALAACICVIILITYLLERNAAKHVS